MIALFHSTSPWPRPGLGSRHPQRRPRARTASAHLYLLVDTCHARFKIGVSAFPVNARADQGTLGWARCRAVPMDSCERAYALRRYLHAVMARHRVDAAEDRCLWFGIDTLNYAQVLIQFWQLWYGSEDQGLDEGRFA